MKDKCGQINNLLACIILLIGWSFITGCLPSRRATSIPFPSRQVLVTPNPVLREVWRVNSGSLPAYSRPTVLSTQLGLLFANDQQQLKLLEPKTGQLLWETEYDGRADSLVTDGQVIYLSNDWRITAYRLVDGQQLWQIGQQASHRAYYLYLKDQFLFEYEQPSPTQDVIRKFDPATGQKLDVQITPLAKGEPSFYLPLEQIYFRLSEDRLWAVDWQTNRSLWQMYLPTGNDVATPVVVGELLVLSVGRIERDLLVLKLYTGEVIWRKSSIVSSPAVLGDEVYAIGEDGSMQVYNLANGEPLGQLSLEPSKTDRTRYDYALVASEENSLIYAFYEDSQELIAFSK